MSLRNTLQVPRAVCAGTLARHMRTCYRKHTRNEQQSTLVVSRTSGAGFGLLLIPSTQDDSHFRRRIEIFDHFRKFSEE